MSRQCIYGGFKLREIPVTYNHKKCVQTRFTTGIANFQVSYKTMVKKMNSNQCLFLPMSRERNGFSSTHNPELIQVSNYRSFGPSSSLIVISYHDVDKNNL